jgi:choline monooxygenase
MTHRSSVEIVPPGADEQYPLPPAVVDARNYSDPDRYEREIERIFYRAWFPVCPSSDLAAARDFVIWERLRQSIAIVRQDDGTVAAWHNVCQHRGAKIVSESGHCATGRFKCPWHGFAYDLGGAVCGIPLKESFDERELAGLRAPAVRVAEWAGFVWLALSDEVPELSEFLGDIGAELSWYELEGFGTLYRHEIRLRANWKLVVDAFNETWHVPFTHSDTLTGMILWRDAALKITPPHTWMTLPVRDYTAAAAAGADHRKTHLCHYLAFPNTIFSCFPTHLQMWSVWPESVSETVLSAWGVVGPTPERMTDEQWASRSERDWDHFLRVVAEDCEVIEAAGPLAHSLGFKRNMFNTAEGRLTAFHREVDRWIAP